MAVHTVKDAIDLLRSAGYAPTPEELLVLGRQLSAYAKEEARAPVLAPLGEAQAGVPKP